MKKILFDIYCRSKGLGALICCFVLPVMISSGQSEEIKKCIYLIEVDQTVGAIDLLNKTVKAYPSASFVRYHLGEAQIKTGQRDLATASFNNGILLDADEPLNYVGRGHVSILEDNLHKAQMDFDKALSMTKSKNVAVLNAIAEAYLGDSRLADKAISLLTKSKSLDAKNPETLLLLGDAYLAQNNGGLAVSNYEKASALNSKVAKPFYKIGLVYLRSRNFDGAQEAFSKAIEIDPAYTLAYKELGELYYQRKDGADAVKAYQKYLSLTDKPETGKLQLAFFFVMAKDFSRANDLFEALVQKADVSPTTLRFYALSLFEDGKHEQSREIFDRYLSAANGTADANDHLIYAKVLLKQNEDSLAVDQLKKSLVLKGDQPDAVRTLAETLYRTKKFTESIQAYIKLKGITPRPTSQDVYTLGRAFYFNNQFESADSTFEKLISMQPDMTVGYLWEARTKSNLDPESEKGLAQPYYTKLIEIAHTDPEKSKGYLVEAYSYLGYYHLLKQELVASKAYWKKVLELNPEDARAKEALKAIN